jgi:hypothetical protein
MILYATYVAGYEDLHWPRISKEAHLQPTKDKAVAAAAGLRKF